MSWLAGADSGVPIESPVPMACLDHFCLLLVARPLRRFVRNTHPRLLHDKKVSHSQQYTNYHLFGAPFMIVPGQMPPLARYVGAYSLFKSCSKANVNATC
jgi:hypothetical protein